MNKLILISTVWITAISLTTCLNQADNKSVANEPAPESSLNPAQNSDSSKTDSLITGKNELAEIYAQAIEEYIAAVNKKEKTNFETLFLGKHFDFPDIDLPATINGIPIHLLTQEEINSNKSIYSKSSPYINLIGFIRNNKAEFVFVTFYPEFKHQYDCYLNFKYNPEKKEFGLDESRIEVLVLNKQGNADHFAIYEDGKYVGDKPVGEN